MENGPSPASRSSMTRYPNIVIVVLIATLTVFGIYHYQKQNGSSAQPAIVYVTNEVHEVTNNAEKLTEDPVVSRRDRGRTDLGTSQCPPYTESDQILGKSRDRGPYALPVPDDVPKKPALKRQPDHEVSQVETSKTSIASITTEVVNPRYGQVVVNDNHGGLKITVNNYGDSSRNTDSQVKTNKSARITPEKPDRTESIISSRTYTDPGSEVKVHKIVSRGNGTRFYTPIGWNVKASILADRSEVECWINIGSKSDPKWIVMGSDEEMRGKITRAESYWIKTRTDTGFKVIFTLTPNHEE